MLATVQVELYFCSVSLSTSLTSSTFYLTTKVYHNQLELIPYNRSQPQAENTLCSSISPQTDQANHNELVQFQIKVPIGSQLTLQLKTCLKMRTLVGVVTLAEIGYRHQSKDLNSRVAFSPNVNNGHKTLDLDIVVKTFVSNVQCKSMGNQQLLMQHFSQAVSFLSKEIVLTSQHQKSKGNIHNQQPLLRRKSSKIQLVSAQLLSNLKHKITNLISEANNQFLHCPVRYFAKAKALTVVDQNYDSTYYTVTSRFNQTMYSREDTTCVNHRLQSHQEDGYHLIVLIHGLNGSSHDLKIIKDALVLDVNSRPKLFLSSKINEAKTDIGLEFMGKGLSIEIQKYISNCNFRVDHISFIGHSLGGLIVRSALPFLHKLADKMHSYITLSTPHFGFIQNSLLSLGLKIMGGNSNKSIDQLLFRDQDSIQSCYLYRLAAQEGLNWFRNLVFFSSRQDKYVPYDSTVASPRKNPHCLQMHSRMFRNMSLNRVIRVSVDFDLTQKSLDDFIGRTAHLKFLEDPAFIGKLSFILGSIWEE